MVTVGLRTAAGTREWDEALGERDGITPFHTWEWLSWVAPLLRCRFVPLVIVSDHKTGGEVVGAMPVLLRRRLGLGVVNWVPFPYLGPVVSTELLGKSLSLLDAWGKRRGVVDIQAALHPTAAGAAGEAHGLFAAKGFPATSDSTYLIPLADRSLEEIWDCVSRQRRDQIRRCQKTGMYLRSAEASELGTVLPTIYQADLQRHGVASSYGEELGERITEALPGIPLRAAAACLEGGEVAGMMITLGGRVSACWMGGAVPAHRDTNASALLYWDAIEWSHGQGCRWLDMVGIPSEGIGTYKRRFGGELWTYPVGHRTRLGYGNLRSLANRQKEAPDR